MASRIESDSFGKIKVPADKYWGAGTQRSLQFFKIGKTNVPIELIHAIAIVKKAAAIVNQKYKDITNKNFITYDEYYKNSNKYDLSLSLDVIYHLVEDEIYEKYMKDLFSSTNKFVIIYSTNWNDDKYNGSHVYHRKFTEYIDINFLNAKLIHHEPNKYPSLSTAEFYIYDLNN